MTKYTKLYGGGRTPQTEAIPGREQDMSVNNAGGVTFKLDAWKRLDRFLILGSDSPTYYVSAAKNTRENAGNIVKLLKEDGPRVVSRVVEISTAGRAYKNDPALFTLALALSEGDVDTKIAAREAVNKVARIGTHWFSFVEAANDLRGWGAALAKAVRGLYENRSAEKLALQVAKYQQRGGWSHADLIALSHPRYQSPEKEAVYRWVKGESLGAREIKDKDGNVVRSYASVEDRLPAFLQGVDAVRKATKDTEVARLIREYNLPREVLPTSFLKSKDVWGALLQPGEDRFMPMTAMIRNLGVMTANGFLTPMGDASRTIVDRLTDGEALRYARVHPIQVLAALLTYKSGQGARGNLSWKPVGAIVDALDEAFYLSFGSVESTGKNRLLAIDVSSSMTIGGGGRWSYGEGLMGVPGLSPNVASAAMAMVAARTERNYMTMGFAHNFRDLEISPRMRLDSVVKATQSHSFGGTDCAIPVQYALKNGIPVESFEIYTDNETWYGQEHTSEALKRYRRETGIPAVMTSIGMTANDSSVADPNDAGMLDVVGFDTATPNIVAEFIKGNV